MFKTFLTRFIKDERGVTAIEYGIIGVALAVGLSVVFSDTGPLIKAITAAFTNIETVMSGTISTE